MSAGRKNTSEKKNWNTPPKYISVIKKFFDGVPQLDPCSNESSMVGAKTEYILPINGLNESWNYDTIFVNPPYGRNAETKTTIKNCSICHFYGGGGPEVKHGGIGLLPIKL
jgi:hypothetical protein